MFECPGCLARTERVTGLCPACGYVGRGREVSATCSGPGCSQPSRARGLCTAHLSQQQRHPGEPLRPLRQRRAEPLVVASVRVPGPVKARVLSDPEGARAALEEWARG